MIAAAADVQIADFVRLRRIVALARRGPVNLDLAVGEMAVGEIAVGNRREVELVVRDGLRQPPLGGLPDLRSST
jgi:hypothetical protein